MVGTSEGVHAYEASKVKVLGKVNQYVYAKLQRIGIVYIVQQHNVTDLILWIQATGCICNYKAL